MLIFMGIGYDFALASLFIQRPIVAMLASSIRQCSFSLYGCPNGRDSLTDSFAWLCVIPIGSLAANMELSGTTRQVPSFGI
jgi:hypothetical protein